MRIPLPGAEVHPRTTKIRSRVQRVRLGATQEDIGMMGWRTTGMFVLVTALVAFASLGGGFHWMSAFFDSE